MTHVARSWAPCVPHAYLKENRMSTKGLLYTAAVALAVVVAYDKYGKRA